MIDGRQRFNAGRFASRGRYGSVYTGDALVDPATDYIGYWPLEDGSGLTATDESGNGNNGTLTNGPTWGEGFIGTWAVDFDATDDRINIPDASIFSFGDANSGTDDNPFTFCAWVYYESDGGDRATILGKYDTLSPYTGEYDFAIKANKVEARLFHYNGTGVFWGRSSTATISSSTWTHVAVTYNGNRTSLGITLWINGSSVASSHIGNNDENHVFNGMGDFASDLFIGASLIGSAAFDGYFGGRIEEVRMYDREFSADDMSDLYDYYTA